MLLRRFFGSGSGPRARTGHLAPSTGDCHWPPPLANRNGDVCLADGHKRRLYTGAPHGHTPIHPDSVHPAHPHAYVDLHRHADALGHDFVYRTPVNTDQILTKLGMVPLGYHPLTAHV